MSRDFDEQNVIAVVILNLFCHPEGVLTTEGSRKRFSNTNLSMYYVYILASKKNGTLYTGVTNSIVRRVYEHKQGIVTGFSKKYTVNQLVWYEPCEKVQTAIEREKKIKGWTRRKKIELIESENPTWKDIAKDWYE